jgi:hypothetical protein
MKSRTPRANRGALMATVRHRLHPTDARMQMALMTLLTGVVGFLASFALLRVGLDRLWLRYALALLMAYCAFFCLLRLWLRLHGLRFGADEIADPTAVADALPDSGPPSVADFGGAGGRFGGSGATSQFGSPRLAATPGQAQSDGSSFEVGSLFDADEFYLVLAIAAAVVGALFASLWIVYSAPSLLAELLVDGVLIGGLYRRLRREPPRSWMITALRRTALPFAATFLLFILAGLYIQHELPGARSMGDVVRHVRQSS